MKIVGCDLHAGQQSIAMVDGESGERTAKALKHEGNATGSFTPRWKVRWCWGIEATGAMQWFWNCWKS
jgi:hypothetical protein